MREKSEHELLATKLNQAECKWILSSYDTPFIRELFANYRIIPLESKSGMDTKKNENTRVTNKEVVILNYTPPDAINTTSTPTRKAQRSRKTQQAQQSSWLLELTEVD